MTGTSSGGMQVVKSLLLAMLFIFLGMLIHAGADRLLGLSDNAMLLINQIIKALAVFFACLLSVRGERILFRCVAVGFLTLTAAYIFFALLSPDRGVFTLQLLQESLMGIALGAVSGVLTASLRR